MLKIVEDCLKKKGYDVIIVGNIQWWGEGYGLEPGLLPLLREQVKQGVGLVYVAPYELPATEDWSMLGVDLKQSHFDYAAQWRPLRPGGPISGVPTEVLPPTNVVGYAPTDGDVFLSADRGATSYPIGVARETNGQRTVVLNYVASRVRAGWGGTLTPFVPFSQLRFHHWEYYHSLLAKAVLWAAKREPDVSLSLTVDPLKAIGEELVATNQGTGSVN
jgi:hypothetical protein